MKEKKFFGLPEKDFLESYYDLIVKGRLKETYLKALIEKGLKAGEDVWIHPTALIRRPELVKVGSHVAIDEYTVVSTQLKIGDYIHISPHVSIIGGEKGLLVMKDFSTIAAGSRVICGSSDYAGTGFVSPVVPDEFKSKEIIKPIIMEKFSHVATNSIVFPGVTFGEGAVLGAASLVKEDLEPWTIYIGVPAKPYKERPKETILRYEREIREKHG